MEFDKQSSIHAGEGSQLGGRKVVLKLASAQQGTKAFRNFPDSFTTLFTLIKKYQKTEEAEPSTVKVTYEDHTGDVIGVSDDEDLLTGFEWADAMPDKTLKLQVTARKANAPQQKAEPSTLLDQPMAQLSINEKKEVPTAETVGRAQTIVQPQTQAQESSSSGSSSEAEGDSSQPDKPAGMVHGSMKVPKKPQVKREDKAYRKQRKMIRKMIRRSMMDHSREVIQGLVEEDLKARGEAVQPQITEEAKASEGNRPNEAEAVHHKVECDGCGVAPIVGPRFKCTVRKNFDYCSACEATKASPHAFLKIPTPDQAPRAMFTIIDENCDAEADFDIHMPGGAEELNQAFQAFGGFRGGHRGHGFRHGMRGGAGRWGHPQPEGTPAWGGAGCGRGGRGGGMHRGMKNQIGYFMRQMFGDRAMHHADETVQPGDAMPNARDEWVPRHNPKRAVPTMPKHLYQRQYVATAGDELTVELIFRNCAHKPYNQGFHLETVLGETAKLAVAPIKVPLPETDSMQTFTVKVPIKILDTAAALSEHTVHIGVTNRKGREVGFAVPLKLKIIEKIDETSLYDKAMQALAQVDMSIEVDGNFEKAITALKEAEYEIDKACALLIQANEVKDKAD